MKIIVWGLFMVLGLAIGASVAYYAIQRYIDAKIVPYNQERLK